MNIKNYTIIALRLMVIFITIQTILTLIPGMIQIGAMYEYIRKTDWESIIKFDLIALPIITSMLLAVLLVLIWKFSSQIVNKITKGINDKLAPTLIAAIDIYAAAIVLIGLYLAASNLSEIITSFIYMLKMASGPGEEWKKKILTDRHIFNFGTFITGIMLLAKNQPLARFFMRQRSTVEHTI